MIVGLLKTKVVIYNSAYALRNCVFKYGDEVSEIVNTYKYLGVWCSNKNKLLSENFAYLSNKASKALSAIQNYCSETLGKLTPRLALKTFNSQILPILLYCTELMYNGKQMQEIEQIQLKFLKIMLGVRRQTSSLRGYRSISYNSFTKDFCFKILVSYFIFTS